MKLKLPKVAESWVKASNEQNLNSYLDCFTETASIDDVGDIINGKNAIANWFTSKEYEYQIEPTEVEESKEKITLTAKVTGTFEGSPINFKLEMKLQSGLIHNLKMNVIQ